MRPHCGRTNISLTTINLGLIRTLVLAIASTTIMVSGSYANDDTWPSPVQMKELFENRTYVSGKEGDVRGFETKFQQFINSQFSAEEQEETQRSITRDDGSIIWSFDAKSQIYSWVDFNQDGLDDVMLQMNHIGYCGSAGCWSYLLQQTSDGFKKVGQFNTDGGFSVGQPINGNYKAIYGIEECSIWNGKEYDYKSGTREEIDSLDWNPHNCGGNYSQNMLDARENCKTCHHKD